MEHLPIAGAVHGVSLVINIDECAVRRGGRQIPFQQHFFGQDHVLQQPIHTTVQYLVPSVPIPSRSQLSILSHNPPQKWKLCRGLWKGNVTRCLPSCLRISDFLACTHRTDKKKRGFFCVWVAPSFPHFIYFLISSLPFQKNPSPVRHCPSQCCELHT